MSRESSAWKGAGVPVLLLESVGIDFSRPTEAPHEASHASFSRSFPFLR